MARNRAQMALGRVGLAFRYGYTLLGRFAIFLRNSQYLKVIKMPYKRFSIPGAAILRSILGMVAAIVHPMNEKPVKVICAWCKVYLRGPLDCETISHGICGSCAEVQLRTISRQLIRKHENLLRKDNTTS